MGFTVSCFNSNSEKEQWSYVLRVCEAGKRMDNYVFKLDLTKERIYSSTEFDIWFKNISLHSFRIR